MPILEYYHHTDVIKEMRIRDIKGLPENRAPKNFRGCPI